MNKVEQTISTLKSLFKQNYILSSGLSGKDSAVVTHCAVEALKQAKEEDPSCLGELYIVTTNTSIDNFEVHNFIMTLHEAAREFAAEHDLPIYTKELKPKLFNLPMVEYIGRGKLLRTMQTASRGRDCTIDWKINPVKQYLSELSETYQTEKIVSISGTRDAESVARANNIAKRGESIDVLARTELGLTLAPIKDWSISDVWALIGQIEDDMIDSFIGEHAKGLRKHYSAGNGGTCDIYFGNNKSNDKSCGARFGCFLCSLVKDDKSLENQIDSSPDTYGYMSSLIDLRRFMNDTLFDMERSRSLLGREVKEGSWVKVGYNQYSLSYRKELLRYVLTIDAVERESALAIGIQPRFELVGYKELIAIQFSWAREGSEVLPAEAITIWHDVHTYGKRYSIPNTSDVQFKPLTLSYGALNFVAGDARMDYRYFNIDEAAQSFDSKFHGLEADPAERKFFKCHQVMLDGQLKMVAPFREGKRNEVDAELAEQYINEVYFDLIDEGILFNEYADVCPTFIVKDLLFNEVVLIRKGGMNRLHQDLKRAQLYSAISSAKRAGDAGVVESIVLANSITELDFHARIGASNDDAGDFQMALSF